MLTTRRRDQKGAVLEITDGIRISRRLFRKAVQQGRSERRGDAYSVPYVEPLSDARTPLADFVNSVLEGHQMVSIVMPAYNEEQALPHSLNALFRQEGTYEVILVDGGSSDRTRPIAESFGFTAEADDRHGCPSVPRSPRLILTASKGRASQMNAGAKVAQGEWLLFLHADTVLPTGAIRRLNAMHADQAIQAGGFRHRFSGTDWRLRLISCLDNLRCRCSRIMYGDQALFVRRTLFEHIGGFPDQPILEDVAICERLLKFTRPVLLSPPVVTDARKFVKMGVWHSFVRVLLIILHVEFGLPILPRSFFQEIR